jgi:dipeptidyl-peptidase-4
LLKTILIAAALTAVPAMAADAPPKLTLERVFGDPSLNGAQPQSLKLSPDGTLVTSVRNRDDEKERFDLWALDTRTGEARMLVDSKKVGSGAELSEAAKMQRERDRSLTGKTGIVSYDWSPDGQRLLMPIDGELYVATRDGKASKIAGTRDALNPVITPRGGFISFVRDQNLFALPIGGGEARQLTRDGAGTIHWGEAEFVAQEEMDRRTGFWWSPDDAYVAVERFDEAPVKIFTRAAIGASGTTTYQQRYPAAGTPNALVELYVMRADGSGQVKVDLGNDPDFYLARVNWTPDGKTLLVQRETRDQGRLDVLRVDPATGKSTVWFSETAGPKSWINLSDDYRFLKDGRLLWSSERNGYRHLYLFDGKTKWTTLTKGPWVVTDLIGVDHARGRAYFTGLKDDVLEKQVYAVDFAKPNAITRLTERGWTNGATMDGAASRLIVTRSNTMQPAQTYLADTAGERIAWINENSVTVQGHPYAPYMAAHRPTEFGKIKAADGSDLYWSMTTPPLEAGKKYPVFFEHYGGPGTGQQVTRGWGGALRQYLVSQGWIYFTIDNRGSYNRGTAFENQLWHAMGTVEVEDQLAGAKYLKLLPFVDGSKIATYGWSYGGYMSLKMLEKTPGVYAAAVAGAPVTDWRLYDTHYTERYMGDPVRDKAAYDASMAGMDAAKITDPLLIIHGMSDDNVFLDNSLAAVAAMQKAGTKFEMMFYPGYTHNVGGAVAVHRWRTIEDFLDRNVKNAK